MTDEEINKWRQAEDRKWREEQAKRLMEDSNAPWSLWPEGGPVGREWTEAYRKAGRLMNRNAGSSASPGAIVAIGGPWGTGKTTIGLALIRRACELGWRSYYSKTSLMLRDLSRPLRFDESIEGFMGAYTRPQLLVLDELNAERLRSWDIGMLAEVIDERYAALRNTVLLTNHDEHAFAELVGSSVVDRLNERGAFITCNWRSYRGDQ